MSSIIPISPISRAGALNPTEAPAVTGGAGSGFLTSMANALGEVQATQEQADSLALQAATGDLQSVSEYMSAVNQAQLTLELTVAVRDRAVEAFNDVMRMQF